MFERALLETVRNKLVESPISKLVPADSIHITAKDEPPPTVGQYFILIMTSQRENFAEDSVSGSKNYVIDRVGIDIVCGARTRLAPTDRLGYYVTKEHLNLSILKDLLVTYISKINSSMNMAIKGTVLYLLKEYPVDVQNVLKEDISIGNGFEYLNCDSTPNVKYPDYFSSTDGSESASIRPAGHTYTLRFLSPSRLWGVQC